MCFISDLSIKDRFNILSRLAGMLSGQAFQPPSLYNTGERMKIVYCYDLMKIFFCFFVSNTRDYNYNFNIQSCVV